MDIGGRDERWEKDNGGIDEESRREKQGKYCRRNKVRGGERARYTARVRYQHIEVISLVPRLDHVFLPPIHENLGMRLTVDIHVH